MRTEHGARMVINAYIPSRREVEMAIQALEIEDEREKEAMRKFYERQRMHDRHAIPLFPRNQLVFRFLRRYWKPFVLSCAVIAAVALLFVIGAFSL